MRIPLYQVDAFSDRPFAGNPAAVCLLDEWPDDRLLQSVAMENNLSETAFLVKQGDSYALRWFTPLVEVDLCGHATLASAFVLFNFVDRTRHEVAFHTRSGVLLVRQEGDLVHMDFPSAPPEPCACPPALARGLGKQPTETLRASAYLAVFDSEEEIRALQPDAEQLKLLDAPYVIVTAPSSGADFVSRVFGPKLGITEDPVTGSAHCVLIPYWAQRSGRNCFRARQVSRRGGDLYCELKERNRVDIAGRAALYSKGEIYL